MRKTRQRISSYEELISGFGKKNSKPVPVTTSTRNKVFSKSFNTGEPLIPKEEYDSFTEYVLQNHQCASRAKN